LGLATTAQVVPLNFSVSVEMVPSSCCTWPTAQMPVADNAVMARSRLPSPPWLGVSDGDHVVPFQCST
jgi:hypothetical protein